jgi:hypothetical protein
MFLHLSNNFSIIACYIHTFFSNNDAVCMLISPEVIEKIGNLDFLSSALYYYYYYYYFIVILLLLLLLLLILLLFFPSSFILVCYSFALMITPNPSHIGFLGRQTHFDKKYYYIDFYVCDCSCLLQLSCCLCFNCYKNVVFLVLLTRASFLIHSQLGDIATTTSSRYLSLLAHVVFVDGRTLPLNAGIILKLTN